MIWLLVAALLAPLRSSQATESSGSSDRAGSLQRGSLRGNMVAERMQRFLPKAPETFTYKHVDAASISALISSGESEASVSGSVSPRQPRSSEGEPEVPNVRDDRLVKQPASKSVDSGGFARSTKSLQQHLTEIARAGTHLVAEKHPVYEQDRHPRARGRHSSAQPNTEPVDRQEPDSRSRGLCSSAQLDREPVGRQELHPRPRGRHSSVQPDSEPVGKGEAKESQLGSPTTAVAVKRERVSVFEFSRMTSAQRKFICSFLSSLLYSVVMPTSLAISGRLVVAHCPCSSTLLSDCFPKFDELALLYKAGPVVGLFLNFMMLRWSEAEMDRKKWLGAASVFGLLAFCMLAVQFLFHFSSLETAGDFLSTLNFEVSSYTCLQAIFIWLMYLFAKENFLTYNEACRRDALAERSRQRELAQTRGGTQDEAGENERKIR